MHDERENLLVSDCVLVADDQKLLLLAENPCNKLAEKAKRRIRHHDVRFFEQSAHLVAAEVAVAFKIAPFELVNVARRLFLVCGREDFSVPRRLCRIVGGILRLKERGLPVEVGLGILGVVCVEVLMSFSA